MNFTISNSTIKFDNETEFSRTIENENITMTTEESDASLATSIETITFITNENNATLSDVNNTAIHTFDSNITEEFINTTTELIENATEIQIASVRSILCIDSEFECCPDGKTAAQVTRLIIMISNFAFLTFDRDLISKDAVQKKNGLNQRQELRFKVNKMIFHDNKKTISFLFLKVYASWKKMLVVAVNMLICGHTIVNKANV